MRRFEDPAAGSTNHRFLRAMAKMAGVAASTVQSIWKAHGLAPHRWRNFKLSNNPAFVAKLTNIVGLYVAPPAHAMVLSIDEKSQIQALDRTQPGLPLKKGRGATMTHDYKRNGTTTLFAALNMLDGTVIGQNMSRYRHQEFIRFLNRIEREVPKEKAIHVILDNYAAHKKDKVRAWLARHHYNTKRPHSALGYRPPAPEAILPRPEPRSKDETPNINSTHQDWPSRAKAPWYTPAI